MLKRRLKSYIGPFFKIFRVVCVVTQGYGTNSTWFSVIIRGISRGYIKNIGLIFIFRSFMRSQSYQRVRFY